MTFPSQLDLQTLVFLTGWVGALFAVAMAGFAWRFEQFRSLGWLAAGNGLLALAMLAIPSSAAGAGLPGISFVAVIALLVLGNVGVLAGAVRSLIDASARQAHADPLTGLLNRRAVLEQGSIELARSRRQGLAMAVLMVDIDYFKAINDGYGHKVGDVVLVQLGRLLAGHTRKFDLCARFGGEEFLVILPGTPLNTAVAVAEKLRVALAAEAWPELDGRRTTASFGVTAFAGQDSLEELIASADRAMHMAKNAGRNCVEFVAI